MWNFANFKPIAYLEAPFTVLGTGGFGRSDTRQALRSFFEVDRHHSVLAALQALVQEGSIAATACTAAIERYNMVVDSSPPWSC